MPEELPDNLFDDLGNGKESADQTLRDAIGRVNPVIIVGVGQDGELFISAGHEDVNTSIGLLTRAAGWLCATLDRPPE